MPTYNIPCRQKGEEIILSLRRQPGQAHQKYAFSFVVKECEFALLHLLAWASRNLNEKVILGIHHTSKK